MSRETQFRLLDLLLAIGLIAIAFGVVRFAHNSRNLWLITSGIVCVGCGICAPFLFRPSLARLNGAFTFLAWWIPVSCIGSFGVWQSAIGRELFVNHLIHWGDVTHVFARWVLVPVTLASVVIGTIRYRRDPRLSVVSVTILACIPLLGVTLMELSGAIRW